MILAKKFISRYGIHGGMGAVRSHLMSDKEWTFSRNVRFKQFQRFQTPRKVRLDAYQAPVAPNTIPGLYPLRVGDSTGGSIRYRYIPYPADGGGILPGGICPNVFFLPDCGIVKLAYGQCLASTWTLVIESSGIGLTYTSTCTFTAVSVAGGKLTIRGACMGVHAADALTHVCGSGEWRYLINSQPCNSWSFECIENGPCNDNTPPPVPHCYFTLSGNCTIASRTFSYGGITTTYTLTRAS